MSGSDEWFTPRPVVHAVVPLLRPGARVWCPFDTERSHFTCVLRKRGFRVTATHIDKGDDFLSYSANFARRDFDYIVSNPPFSLKDDIIPRLFRIGLPFAMVMPVTGLFDSAARVALFEKSIDFGVMYLTPRVHYLRTYNQYDPKKNALQALLHRLLKPAAPPFQSCYLTYKLQQKQIMFSRWREYEAKGTKK